MNGWDLYNKLKNFNINLPDNWQLFILIFVILFLVVRFWSIVYAWWTRRIVTAKVTGKDRVFYPLKVQSIYLIFTDVEVFKSVDCFAYWKWNSSDVYGMLEVGESYEFIVHGKRRRWRSNYRNIVKAKKYYEILENLEEER